MLILLKFDTETLLRILCFGLGVHNTSTLIHIPNILNKQEKEQNANDKMRQHELGNVRETCERVTAGIVRKSLYRRPTEGNGKEEKNPM